MKRKVQVWIYHGGKVLVLKTRPDRGGFWQPVTGGVEKGESLAAAALREAREETGLKFRGEPVRIGEPFRFVSRWRGECEEQGFSLEAKNLRVVLDPSEHTEYQWMSPGWAARRIKFPSNRKLLAIFRKGKKK